CPYASRNPFEVLVAPRRHQALFSGLSDDEAQPLSRLLGRVLTALSEALSGADINLVLDLPPSHDTLTRGALGLEHLTSFWHWRLHLVPLIPPFVGFVPGTDIHINPSPPEDAARPLRALIDRRREGKTPT